MRFRIFCTRRRGPSERGLADKQKGAITNRGHTVQELSTSVSSGSVWADAVQLTLKSSDAVVLIVPEPGSPGANNAFFEVGAARALGKPVLAVMPDRGGRRKPRGGGAAFWEWVA